MVLGFGLHFSGNGKSTLPGLELEITVTYFLKAPGRAGRIIGGSHKSLYLPEEPVHGSSWVPCIHRMQKHSE